MKNGTISETGTHKELMSKDGEYAKLYNIQAESFLSEASNNVDELEVAKLQAEVSRHLQYYMNLSLMQHFWVTSEYRRSLTQLEQGDNNTFYQDHQIAQAYISLIYGVLIISNASYQYLSWYIVIHVLSATSRLLSSHYR
jgi:hypothetical protein